MSQLVRPHHVVGAVHWPLYLEFPFFAGNDEISHSFAHLPMGALIDEERGVVEIFNIALYEEVAILCSRGSFSASRMLFCLVILRWRPYIRLYYD